MSSGSDYSSFLTSRPVVTASVTACAALVGVWLLVRWRRSPRKVATVTGIYIYPVKSCQAMSVTTAECEARGFCFDRRWVVIDRWSKNVPEGTAGAFQTQKTMPKLAQIKPTALWDVDRTIVLRLSAPGMDDFTLRQSDTQASETVRIAVYGIEGEGVDCGNAVAAWLAEFTGLPGARLVYMPDNIQPRRLADSDTWGRVGGVDQVAFANFSPYMMANEKSLDELNTRLENPVDMRRFRPNIVVSSCGKGFSEDSWKSFSIGAVPFRFLKKCGRCPMTTLDPETGRRLGPEPLSTLREFRLDTSDKRHGQSPCFGVNLALGELTGGATVNVGDEVVVS